jgi:hypothetical protein
MQRTVNEWIRVALGVLQENNEKVRTSIGFS